MPKKDETWVEVAATGQDEEAVLISGMLSAAGIENEVEDAHGSYPLPENLGTLGTARIVVPPAQAEEARALLEKADARGKRTTAELAQSEDGDTE